MWVVVLDWPWQQLAGRVDPDEVISSVLRFPAQTTQCFVATANFWLLNIMGDPNVATPLHLRIAFAPPKHHVLHLKC